MAWRDSRKARARLVLYMGSIVLGVAALVGIASFGSNLEESVNDQAKLLLGADVQLSSRTPFSPEDAGFATQLASEHASEVRFSSMALFPLQDETRLVEVRALEGAFPFYGELETNPAASAQSFRDAPGALVDETLMLQYGATIGDPVRLGRTNFPIVGMLRNIPGESPTASLIGPRVFIAQRYLEETGLIGVGSRISHRLYLKFSGPESIEPAVAQLEARFEDGRVNLETVEERKKDLGRSMENLYRYLSLVGFVALLLGGIGVASAIHLYVKQRLATVALLRCLGATSRQAFAIYLIQTLAVGSLGVLLGALLGVSVQRFLPLLLQDFIPVTVGGSFSWRPIIQGLLVGVGMVFLFALLPLSSVRRISPLRALRSEYEGGSGGLDWLRVSIWLLLAGGVLAFALVHTRRVEEGLGFFAAILITFALLILTGKGLMLLARKATGRVLPFVWRQGLANLYRPYNQTLVLILALGLGTFLIVTLYVTQASLLAEIEDVGRGGRPNLVFYDIQSDQSAAVRRMVEEAGLPVLQDVPIVTMRLQSVKGRDVTEFEGGGRNEEGPRRWALRREYRSTYRDNVIETETIVAGDWHGRVQNPEEPVPVSLAQSIAEDLKVAIGDELVFDVQGIPVATRVASLREIEWERLQPNFFVVFPSGVLEGAPQFHVLVTRTDRPQESAQLQRRVVRQFPNVSTIDLTLVLETVDQVLDKVAFVIRFMSLFSILTGLIVLSGAVVSGRYQRMKEMVLLRTLGATRRQVTRIMLAEYAFLGVFAALTGVVLSVGGSWALLYFTFEAGLNLPLGALAASFLLVIALTVLVGMLNSRGAGRRPLINVLRASGEGGEVEV